MPPEVLYRLTEKRIHINQVPEEDSQVHKGGEGILLSYLEELGNFVVSPTDGGPRILVFHIWCYLRPTLMAVSAREMRCLRFPSARLPVLCALGRHWPTVIDFL